MRGLITCLVLGVSVAQQSPEAVVEETSDNIETALLGVAFAVFGIFFDNFGITIMKMSLNKQARETLEMVKGNAPMEPKKAYWKQKRWLLGFVSFLAGNGLNAVGLSYAPQSLFAAVGALTLVFNAFNARIILKEEWTRRIQFGTLLVVCGSVLAVFFGSHAAEDFTLEDLGEIASAPAFVTYAALIAVLILATWATIRYLERMQGGLGKRASFSVATKEQLAQTMPQAEIKAREEARRKRHVALSFLYPWMTGVIGSFTIIFAKSSAEMVTTSIAGDNQFTKWPTTFLIVGTLCVGATQIHWLNRGLEHYDQMLIIPTFNVCYTLFSVLGGGFFFREFNGFGVQEWSLFPISVCVTFIGIFYITTKSRSQRKLARIQAEEVVLDAKLATIERQGSLSSSMDYMQVGIDLDAGESDETDSASLHKAKAQGELSLESGSSTIPVKQERSTSMLGRRGQGASPNRVFAAQLSSRSRSLSRAQMHANSILESPRSTKLKHPMSPLTAALPRTNSINSISISAIAMEMQPMSRSPTLSRKSSRSLGQAFSFASAPDTPSLSARTRATSSKAATKAHTPKLTRDRSLTSPKFQPNSMPRVLTRTRVLSNPAASASSSQTSPSLPPTVDLSAASSSTGAPVRLPRPRSLHHLIKTQGLSPRYTSVNSVSDSEVSPGQLSQQSVRTRSDTVSSATSAAPSTSGMNSAPAESTSASTAESPSEQANASPRRSSLSVDGGTPPRPAVRRIQSTPAPLDLSAHDNHRGPHVAG